MTTKDAIQINDLKVDCIIGILPHERGTLQPVILDIKLVLDLTAAAENEEIRRTVDYAVVSSQVKFILEKSKFELLETAALAICSWLVAPVPSAHLYCVDSAEVRIRKPLSLEGNGIPQICIQRFSRDIKVESHPAKGVIQDVVFKTEKFAVIRVHQIGSSDIPGCPLPYTDYADLSNNPRDLLRLAWKK